MCSSPYYFDVNLKSREEMTYVLYISLYQTFLISSVYEIALQVKRPWKGMDYRETVFVNKMKKMSAIKFTS